METVAWILILMGIGIIGFALMKRVDAFFDESCSRQRDTLECREDVIKIACENPIMLSSVSTALEKSPKAFKKTAFYFYTGCRKDLQSMLEKESADILLLMEEMDVGEKENYEKKISSYMPSSLPEPLTGIRVEPIGNQRAVMYVLWNKKHITEQQRRLLSNI